MALTSLTAIINGTSYPFELDKPDADGYYSITLPAGSASSFREEGGYFPVEITAIDDSTPPLESNASQNAVLKENLKLYVYEVNPPEIVIDAPGESSYLVSNTRPEIKFTVKEPASHTVGYSGINPESIELKLDNNVIPRSSMNIQLSEDKKTCVCSYTPADSLSDGKHSIAINAKDNDGNSATTAEREFEIDASAPNLDVRSPSNNLVTSNSTLKVWGYAPDNNKPVIVYITDGKDVTHELTIEGDDGYFEKYIDLVPGANKIKVVAKDTVDNRTSEQEFNVTYNSTAPIFSDVQILLDGKQVSASHKVPTTGSYIIRCKVTTS